MSIAPTTSLLPPEPAQPLPIEQVESEHLDKLRSMNVDELIAMLLGELSMMVKHIYLASLVLRVLREKGVPEDVLRSKVKYYPEYHRINERKLLAELIVVCNADRKRVKLLGSLPVNDQREIADRRKRIPLVIPDKDGLPGSVLQADPLGMSHEQLEQAVDAAGGREVPEDVQRLRMHQERKEASLPIPPGPIEMGAATLDPSGEGIDVAKGGFLGVDLLERIVRRLRELRRRRKEK